MVGSTKAGWGVVRGKVAVGVLVDNIVRSGVGPDETGRVMRADSSDLDITMVFVMSVVELQGDVQFKISLLITLSKSLDI